MIKKEIFGKTLKEQLLASARDRLYSFLLADGAVRGAIVNGTRMVNEMRANHELGILETLVLGHAYLAAGLMSAELKGNNRLSLQIECSGSIKGFVVEGNAFGEVRGHLKNVPIPIEKPLQNFDLSPFFGAGFITVTRYLEDAKQPFTGTVMLRYGNLAQDLTHYYWHSEQVPTAFDLSIQFNGAGKVTGAGGLFLQAMPGAGEEITAGLENLIRNLPSLGAVLARGKEPNQLISDVFQAYTPKFLANHRVEFMCHCNPERIQSLLMLLPVEDLKDMRDNGPFPIEIRCHHCNTRYHFSQSDVQKIYGKRFPNN